MFPREFFAHFSKSSGKLMLTKQNKMNSNKLPYLPGKKELKKKTT